MSSVAGRVLLIPKGDYDASVTYNTLDVVLYEGDSYVAKATTTGNLPTNTTYWQPLTAIGDEVDDLKQTLMNSFDALGLSVVSGKLCQTYNE